MSRRTLTLWYLVVFGLVMMVLGITGSLATPAGGAALLVAWVILTAALVVAVRRAGQH